MTRREPRLKGLVLLGHLTELAFRGGAYGWALRSAPLLAYDEKGRLHIVYGGRVVGIAKRGARASYKATHWGDSGLGRVIAGQELRGPFKKGDRLGIGTSITYTTTKGGSKLTDYEHEWGEGAPSGKRVVRPTVVQSRGFLALDGGSYLVTPRGIVG